MLHLEELLLQLASSTKRKKMQRYERTPPRQYNRSEASRLRWTAELHGCFIEAVDQLGGPQKATPKRILQMMGVGGLDVSHVKSHLQMYRIAKNGTNVRALLSNKSSRRGGRMIKDRDLGILDSSNLWKSPQQAAVSSYSYSLPRPSGKELTSLEFHRSMLGEGLGRESSCTSVQTQSREERESSGSQVTQMNPFQGCPKKDDTRDLNKRSDLSLATGTWEVKRKAKLMGELSLSSTFEQDEASEEIPPFRDVANTSKCLMGFSSHVSLDLTLSTLPYSNIHMN